MMLRFFSLWGPVVGWCGLIFYLSGIPDLGTGLGQWDLLLRKLAHIGEYAVLAGLLWRAFGGSGIRRPPLLFWTSFLAAAVYAVSDEYHQSFVPGRFGSSLDVFLDSAGALLAASLLRWRHRRAVPPAGMLIALLVFSTGCSRVRFAAAERHEKSGRYEQALQAYLRWAEKSPEHNRAPMAFYRAGRIASNVLGDYALAREIFQRLLNRYGDVADWGSRAEWALFNSPNYFPLIPNAEWVEGDSDTGGWNARIETTCRAREGGAGVVFARRYYAGKQFVRALSVSPIYEKRDLELVEYLNARDVPTVILKYPFETGASWTSVRQRKKVTFTIQGTRTVRVRAGEFKDCLMVRERSEGVSAAWKVEYYAPGVGRVLTTLATATSEKRNTELLSYNLGTGQETEAHP